MSDSSCREDGVMPGDEMAIKRGVQSRGYYADELTGVAREGGHCPECTHGGGELPPQYG